MTDLGQGAVIADKYRLDFQVGKGGMGSVWAARHLQLETQVALKFIDPLAETGDARLRFEREAQAAAKLRSPHVVQILDYGVDGDRPYIAMELLEGEDLGERLRREKRISVQAAAHILNQAAKALRRAHDAGLIHRDLKPSNIFLARFDDDEVVKLLDFGVAKIREASPEMGSAFTQTGVIFGSPAYMSPEQARGARVIDHRSDLWSLAVILFRAITGVKPFDAASIGDLVIKLCIDPIPVASKVAPRLTPEIDQFFERAFARDPEQRFPSAVAMASEFDTIARELSMASGPRPSRPPDAPSTPSPSANPSIRLYALPEPKPPPRRPSYPFASMPDIPAPARRSSAPGSSGPQGPPESFSTPPLAPRPPGSPSMINPSLMRTVPITSEPNVNSFVPSAATVPMPSTPPSTTPSPMTGDPRAAYPSLTPTPSQPLMTPTPGLLQQMPPIPWHQNRIVLWGIVGAVAVLLLVAISAASRRPLPDGGEGHHSSAAPSTAAEAMSNTERAAPAPYEAESAVLAQPPAASAAPEVSAAPASPPPEPSSSATAAPRTPPKGAGSKGGKGRVPNFGY